jgi:glycosyltransferase involved in cell wall biosynthesis
MFSMTGMRIPLLVSVRNDPARDYSPHPFFSYWMERKAAGCVFQTEEARKAFHRCLQKKARIIWNPVDEKYLTAAEEYFRTEDNRYQEKNFIAAVGRISAQKNHLLLIKAFNHLKDKWKYMELRIYGEDCEKDVKEALEQYIRKQGLSERVRFMGQCSTLEKELQGAALYVLPSDYEGMPNALAEAMVLGIPVIATDCPCGGSAMLIQDGVSGLLIKPGEEEKLAEAMEKLLEDRTLAERLGRNAAKIADKIRPDRVYLEWKDYVETLIND